MIWFVIFHPKEPGDWWCRTYRHVSLAGYNDGIWTYLDLHRGRVEVDIFKGKPEVEDFLSYLTAFHVVVKAPVGEARHFLRPMSCVAFVKHTIGLRSRALLPDGLFRDLTQDFNAEIMNEAGQPASGDGRTTAPASAR